MSYPNSLVSKARLLYGISSLYLYVSLCISMYLYVSFYSELTPYNAQRITHKNQLWKNWRGTKFISHIFVLLPNKLTSAESICWATNYTNIFAVCWVFLCQKLHVVSSFGIKMIIDLDIWYDTPQVFITVVIVFKYVNTVFQFAVQLCITRRFRYFWIYYVTLFLRVINIDVVFRDQFFKMFNAEVELL